MPNRYCFVVPRYFDGLAGGAETLLGTLARQLLKRGDDVELITTCAVDNRTWENALPPGKSIVNGLKIKRFPVDSRCLNTWIPIQIAINEGKSVSYDDQLKWMKESVNSSRLYEYIANNGNRFDLFFFAPYLFGTTFWGSQIHPHKSVLVPCLHDESYAYLDLTAAMFRGVRGCIFNTAPEMHLARSLYGELTGDVVGMGFDLPGEDEISELTTYLPSSCKYVLYVGRKEMGKNVHLLIDYFCEAKSLGLIPGDIKLAILGGGSFSDLYREDALERGDIIDLPHLSETEKKRVLRHALCLCQPSVNESFSIVLMEAWMVGVPVIVHASCAVTRHHVVSSGGGLYFSSPSDLGGVVRHLLEAPEFSQQLRAAGYDYIKREFSWSAVIERFDKVVAELLQQSANFPEASDLT